MKAQDLDRNQFHLLNLTQLPYKYPKMPPIGRDVGSVYRVSGDLNQSVVFSLEQNGSSPIPFSVESNGTILVGGPVRL
jgi:hypothetical protein